MPDKSLFAASPESVGVDPEKLEALFARVEKEVPRACCLPRRWQSRATGASPACARSAA